MRWAGEQSPNPSPAPGAGASRPSHGCWRSAPPRGPGGHDNRGGSSRPSLSAGIAVCLAGPAGSQTSSRSLPSQSLAMTSQKCPQSHAGVCAPHSNILPRTSVYAGTLSNRGGGPHSGVCVPPSHRVLHPGSWPRDRRWPGAGGEPLPDGTAGTRPAGLLGWPLGLLPLSRAGGSVYPSSSSSSSLRLPWATSPVSSSLLFCKGDSAALPLSGNLPQERGSRGWDGVQGPLWGCSG